MFWISTKRSRNSATVISQCETPRETFREWVAIAGVSRFTILSVTGWIKQVNKITMFYSKKKI